MATENKTGGRGEEQDGGKDAAALLSKLGDLARSEQADDRRFERVARGEASSEELASLSEAAERDAELALRLEASRPLDAKVVDRIASRVITRNDAKTPPLAGVEEAATKEKLSEEKPAASPTHAKKILRPTFGRRLVTIAGPLALAAALVLYITTSRGPEGPELPPYVVTASGEQAMRGNPSSSDSASAASQLRLSSKSKDARFEIVLRPATAPIGKVVAYAFTVTSKGAEPAPLDAKVEIAPEGSIRLMGAARLLDGVSEIRVVVGSPAAIGKFDDAVTWARGAGDKRVRVLTIPINRD